MAIHTRMCINRQLRPPVKLLAHRLDMIDTWLLAGKLGE